MTWNYRVIQFVCPVSNEPWQAIHEVHYDQESRPVSYAEDPASVVSSDDAGNNKGLDWVLERMREALAKPVLVERDFQR
jgi:hypothetical protein